MGSLKVIGATTGLLALAACGQSVGAPVERLAMDRLEASPGINGAPDAEGAAWERLVQGGLRFGKPGQMPLLSLSCETESPVGPAVRIVRHVPADPGAKAMLAVIGNGRVLRAKADAVRRAEGWRWEGLVPVGDIHLEVFAGRGSLEATLPGGGTFKTAPSPEPAELYTACRKLVSEKRRRMDGPVPSGNPAPIAG